MVRQFDRNFRVGQGGLLVVTATQDIPQGDQPRIVLVDASAGPVTITLFKTIGLGGKRVCIKKIDSSANAVTIAAAAGETIDGSATDSLTDENESIDLFSDNEDWLKGAQGAGGGGGGGGGNTEKVLDVVVSSNAISQSFNLDRMVALDGSDVGLVKVIISNILLSATDILDVQFNGEQFGTSVARGVSSDGTTVTAFSAPAISDDVNMAVQGASSIIIEIPGDLASDGNDTGVLGHWMDDVHVSTLGINLNTGSYPTLDSIQIRTRNGVQTINIGTRIVIYAINKD